MPEETSSQTEAKRMINLKSLERLSNLPILSTGLNITSGVYGRVKESNSAVRVVLESAEHTVHKAAQLVEPVATTFEKPINMADSVVCSTMDFVGNNIPKVVEAPQQIYTKAMSAAPVQVATGYVKTVSDYGIQKVNNLYNQMQKQNTSEDETERETEPDTQVLRRLVVSNEHMWSNKIELWETLRPSSYDVAAEMDEYFSVDDNLEVAYALTDEEITRSNVEQMINENSNVNLESDIFFADQTDCLENDPTRSFDVIRKTLLSIENVPDEIFRHLNILETYVKKHVEKEISIDRGTQTAGSNVQNKVQMFSK